MEKLTPGLQPQPINWEHYLHWTPEKIELIEGFLIDGPDEHTTREKLFLALLINLGLERAVRFAPREQWEKALQKIYPD